MTTFKIGNAIVKFMEGWTEIRLNAGGFLSIPWIVKPGDDERAAGLGYSDPVAMNKDHDALHVLAGHMLGLPDSGGLTYATTGKLDPLWRYEEDVVFALHRYVAASGRPIETFLDRFRLDGPETQAAGGDHARRTQTD